MSRPLKHKVLRIFLIVVAFTLLMSGGFVWWLSSHYKQLIKDQLPAAILQSTDSIYHVSFNDVNVNLFTRTVSITGLKLAPDMQQVKRLQAAHRHTPPTISTLSIPAAQAYGIHWRDLAHGVFDCDRVMISKLKWRMLCAPNPSDKEFIRDKKKAPKITRFAASQVDFVAPDITYDYQGVKDSFTCHMAGGTAELHNWAYNYDDAKDTSTFLYAQNGKLRIDSFILNKKAGRYIVKKPLLDFKSTASSVTLENVKLNQLTYYDDHTTNVREVYDLKFPSIELGGFNWNRLINDDHLQVAQLNSTAPDIELRFMRENEDNSARMGSYPNQLLLQVGIHTNIHVLNIYDGHLKYTEITKEKHEGVIEFTQIKGSFSNITNIDSVIAGNKSCVIKLEGKFGNKSPVSATFDMRLSDTTGHFVMDGNMENLDGDDVMKQVQAFTFVEVTSFHMSQLKMHIEGDEHYGKGDFTMLYKDLKISLFKFKSKYRKGKHGPFSFLGSALVLFPSNPMPDHGVRTVTTYFDREPDKGFISLLWRNIYRAARKTAVRDERLIDVTDGKEDKPGEPPHKKSFLKRLFTRKKSKG